MQNTSQPVIRSAVPDDVAAMVRCDAYAQSHAGRRRQIQEAVSRQQCLVAIDASTVVGFIVLKHDFFEQAFIPLVVVAKDHRRMGVGLQLLHAVETHCRTPKLFTSTNASNVAAQALLSRAGFVRSGIVENLDAQDSELVFFKWVR